MAISEWELWACAQQIIKQHGEGAAAHAATRVADLVKAGDGEGARTWRLIAERIEQLADFRGARPKSPH